MKIPTDKEVEAVRAAYPSGTRVQLVHMDDPQAPPIGTKGTVICVDDVGSLLVDWDNGSGMNVAYGKDKVLILNTECAYCAVDEEGESVSKPLIEKECKLFDTKISIQQQLYGSLAEYYIAVGNTQIICEQQPYKYCPMCGRKLTKG